LLCISDDFAGHDKPGNNFPITDYAFSKGVTIRDDSILVQKFPIHWYHAEMAQQFWPELPVILEHQHYELSNHGFFAGYHLAKHDSGISLPKQGEPTLYLLYGLTFDNPPFVKL